MNTHSSATAATAEQRDLLARIAQGDRLALRAAFTERGSTAMAVALRILDSRAEAEAVVQDTFVEVWRTAREEEARGTHLATWIAAIARRRAAERLRGRRGQAEPAPAEPPGPAPLPIESAECRQTRRRMSTALASLPPAQRAVLELAWFGCLDVAAIAVRVGETSETVEAWMAAGLERLAATLHGTAEKSA